MRGMLQVPTEQRGLFEVPCNRSNVLLLTYGNVFGSEIPSCRGSAQRQSVCFLYSTFYYSEDSTVAIGNYIVFVNQGDESQQCRFFMVG